ncbi:hypothetical protein [Aquimarina spinulae]|nr:hypothetical protein [Aquimarina spinulae]
MNFKNIIIGLKHINIDINNVFIIYTSVPKFSGLYETIIMTNFTVWQKE